MLVGLLLAAMRSVKVVEMLLENLGSEDGAAKKGFGRGLRVLKSLSSLCGCRQRPQWPLP